MQINIRTALVGAAIVLAGCIDSGHLITSPVAQNSTSKNPEALSEDRGFDERDDAGSSSRRMALRFGSAATDSST